MNNNLCKDLNYGYDYNNGIFEKKIPNFNNRDNYNILNPHGESSTDFFKTTFGYTSLDPRLYDAARNNRLTLDKPPPDGNIQMENIYKNPTLEKYKCGVYKNGYSGVKAGQIVYYESSQTSVPFVRPVFMESATMNSINYTNPMGGKSIVYTREPIKNPDFLNTKRREYDGGLSWLRDSSFFREDIISRQQIKNNEQKYICR